eukprot:13096526-Alexandrium_andersonii.AAC.1
MYFQAPWRRSTLFFQWASAGMTLRWICARPASSAKTPRCPPSGSQMIVFGGPAQFIQLRQNSS